MPETLACPSCGSRIDADRPERDRDAMPPMRRKRASRRPRSKSADAGGREVLPDASVPASAGPIVGPIVGAGFGAVKGMTSAASRPDTIAPWHVGGGVRGDRSARRLPSHVRRPPRRSPLNPHTGAFQTLDTTTLSRPPSTSRFCSTATRYPDLGAGKSRPRACPNPSYPEPSREACSRSSPSRRRSGRSVGRRPWATRSRRVHDPWTPPLPTANTIANVPRFAAASAVASGTPRRLRPRRNPSSPPVASSPDRHRPVREFRTVRG